MNKYKKAIMEISIFEVPPADNSCCYRMQGAVYKIKEIARKIFLYEAMANMLDGFAGGTVSENICAIVAAFLEKTGHNMIFLKDYDRLRIKEIRRAITSYR